MSKYDRIIFDKDGNYLSVDVYAVLEAFQVTCPAMAHAAKKVLCCGQRGAKDSKQDIEESIQALERAKTLLMDRQESIPAPETEETEDWRTPKVISVKKPVKKKKKKNKCPYGHSFGKDYELVEDCFSCAAQTRDRCWQRYDKMEKKKRKL